MIRFALCAALTLSCGLAVLGCSSADKDQAELADQEPVEAKPEPETQPDQPPLGNPRPKLIPGEVVDEQKLREEEEDG